MSVNKAKTPTKDGKYWFFRVVYKDEFNTPKRYNSKKYFTRAEAKEAELEFLNCACRFTERSNMEDNSKRKEIKKLIEDMKENNPNVDINIFRSMCDVNLKTIIGYHKDDKKYNFLDDYEVKK